MRTRNTHINIRTTPQEKTRFQRNAKKCGLPLSEFFRQLANGYEPRSVPPLEYLQLTRTISEIYNDFRNTGDEEYSRLLADVLLELQAAIAPTKRHGYDEDMAGS
jgi:hypothetical protein